MAVGSIGTATSVDGSMVSRGGINVGNVYQRNDKVQQALWMELVAGNVSQTSSSITFAVRGGFAYQGYMNFVPQLVGYLAFYPNGSLYTSGAGIVFHNTQAANKGKTHYCYSTFTMQKTTSTVSIVPYTQIGCINYWSADGTAGNDWTYFNTEYGIMCMYSDSSGNSGLYTANNAVVSYNNITRTLQCYSLFSNNANNQANYANGYKVTGKSVAVYDSSGKPHYASNIYVYDSAGKPRRATKITVYDSSGKPHTMNV